MATLLLKKKIENNRKIDYFTIAVYSKLYIYLYSIISSNIINYIYRQNQSQKFRRAKTESDFVPSVFVLEKAGGTIARRANVNILIIFVSDLIEILSRSNEMPVDCFKRDFPPYLVRQYV